MTADRPYVTVSYAQSADGRIATAEGRAERISGPESLEFAHTLRRDHQTVLVGIGTVLKDDPLLTCRLPGGCPSPVRVVLDSHLRMPEDSRLAASARDYRTIVFTLPGSSAEHERRLQAAGVEVERAEAGEDGRPDLRLVLRRLAGLGFRSLFVEGGARVITAFLGSRLVDTLYLVSAPLFIGRGTEAVGELHTTDITAAPRGRTVSLRRAGEDVIWEIDLSAPVPERSTGHTLGDSTREPSDRQRDEAAGTASRRAEALGEGGPGTARALYFTAPGRVELREEPVSCGDGMVPVESRVIGISHGTERHLWEGSFPRGGSEDGLEALSGGMEYPLKYGYMNAGETAGGERVFAFMPHQDRFCARESQLVRFPPETAFEDIVLYPSVETAYTIASDAAVLPGERVLLIGQGMIGLLTAEILRLLRGLRLAALEPASGRAELSSRMGLLCLSPHEEGTPERLREYFGGGADKVINLSASGAGLQQGIDLAAFGAVIVEASWYGSREVRLRLGEAFHRRRLTLKSSQVSTLPDGLRGRWEREQRTEVVRRLTCELQPSRYISRRYPLAEAQRAYREIFAGEQEILQAVLLP
jgi:riboflavin-specific deaminase-like protein